MHCSNTMMWKMTETGADLDASHSVSTSDSTSVNFPDSQRLRYEAASWACQSLRVICCRRLGRNSPGSVVVAVSPPVTCVGFDVSYCNCSRRSLKCHRINTWCKSKRLGITLPRYGISFSRGHGQEVMKFSETLYTDCWLIALGLGPERL